MLKVAEPIVPSPGFQIGLEPLHAARDDVLVEERKPRDSRSHAWIEIRLGSTPIRGEEPIGAVVRDSDAIQAAIAQVVLEGRD